MKHALVAAFALAFLAAAAAQQQRGPRSQPGAAMTIYAPNQHELYDGRFVIRGTNVYQVGMLNDRPPWDHMGDDGRNLRQVGGEILIDVDEIENTGAFRAELDLPEGRYVVELERFHEFSPARTAASRRTFTSTATRAAAT